MQVVGLHNAGSGVRVRGDGKPRILYVTQHWPHQAGGASELRSFHLRRALEQHADVGVVVLNVEGGGENWSPKLQQGYRLVEVHDVKEFSNQGMLGKLRWALDARSHHPQGKSAGSEATSIRCLRPPTCGSAPVHSAAPASPAPCQSAGPGSRRC